MKDELAAMQNAMDMVHIFIFYWVPEVKLCGRFNLTTKNISKHEKAKNSYSYSWIRSNLVAFPIIEKAVLVALTKNVK